MELIFFRWFYFAGKSRKLPDCFNMKLISRLFLLQDICFPHDLNYGYFIYNHKLQYFSLFALLYSLSCTLYIHFWHVWKVFDLSSAVLNFSEFLIFTIFNCSFCCLFIINFILYFYRFLCSSVKLSIFRVLCKIWILNL